MGGVKISSPTIRPEMGGEFDIRNSGNSQDMRATECLMRKEVEKKPLEASKEA
jgi:hypothetical protein